MMPSADTQAVLLLCGGLPGGKSLTPTEYDALARHLHAQGLRPADLLEELPTAALEQSLQRWAQEGIWVLSRADALYPPLLKRRLGRRCPPLLYGVGRAKLLRAPGVAVVGSRDASPGALSFAASVAREAVSEGLCVVSGGARGVDAAAMAAAGSAVVGVLPGGLARAARRGAAGCLVSAFPPDAAFSAGLAMARNGHIYCLSQAVFVADSGPSGGTWAGAVEGLKRGWAPVFVRRGEGAGNAALVEAGARWHDGGPGVRRLLGVGTELQAPAQ